jgi:hypothetical protein
MLSLVVMRMIYTIASGAGSVGVPEGALHEFEDASTTFRRQLMERGMRQDSNSTTIL